MAVPFNMANRCPALCVPDGTASGFPVGVQVVGHPFDESGVFAIGPAIKELRSRFV
ncbi:hypothetical protein [Nocardiopsis sp. CC223A]|uniref:hypothetical protein n=1 Tax=Nocardiopsis sp. CC223A TaxID=3044051 RepID=UPI0035576DDA